MIDGQDHINVYSKGHTALGRLLSNFARTPFTLHGLRFESVEAWWYWRQLPEDDAELRKMWGYNAKRMGRLAVAKADAGSRPSKEDLKEVYRLKVEANTQLKQMLMASTLPFDHYYDYGRGPVQTEWRWTGQLWNEVREELKHDHGVGVPSKEQR